MPEVIVIIVGFRNAGDVVRCLRSLSQAQPGPRFDVFVAENGGPEGLTALHNALAEETSPCRQPPAAYQATTPSPRLAAMNFTLPRDAVSGDANVYVALMPENLGYAGAINALLRPLLQLPGWHAAWILNPDTEPAPSALFELADYARKHQKGMVGSRIICATHPDDVHVCGLSWRKLTARTVEIDHSTAAYCESGPNNVEAYIDSPDGASIYVSRSLIERIGLMDECYFLYFEDVEWGLRAKKLDELGYAYRSVVWHKGGTTTGSAGTRAGRSKFVVYMEFRNRIIFVRHQHAAWLPWTVLMQAVHMATYLAAGAFTNMLAAGRGVLAGLSGEIGRPDDILQAHTARLAGHSAGGRVLPSGALATVRSSGRGRVRAISNKQAQGG